MSALETRWWAECGAECELSAWEHIGAYLWNTQTCNQAVGTGVMYGVHALRFLVAGDGSWVGCGDCRADYRERGLFLLADQSARIGFGAC